MPNDSDRWGIWVESRPGCAPPATQWWGTNGQPMVMGRCLAEAVAETCNRIEGERWSYAARELVTIGS